jgi:octaprenyl-diphosphate synthase
LTALTSQVREPPIRGKLESLQALVDADMRLVNQLIVERLDSPIRLIPELAGHLIAAGGKRVRPMLTLIAAQLCGYQGRRHLSLAAAVEFIHSATLLHDDVVDQSDLRRGLATANAIWGNKPSVLVGDFLFARAFQLMVEDGSLDVLSILANASAVIAEGEVAQLMTANDAKTTEDAYIRVVTAKTATLFAAAAQIGAVVAERPGSEVEALRFYGESLGIAFQLVDDVLDYSGDLGKSLGDDLAEGKPTLPLIYTMRCGSPQQAALVRRAIAEGGRDDFAEVLEAIRACGALDYARAAAQREAEAAARALSTLPESEYKRCLLELASFAVTRSSTHIGA